MLLTVLYIIAITAEAMTGALSAGRRSMDLFGVVLIACVTALGGGSVRDMLLGHYPLTWVRHPEYLALTAVAALVTVFIAPLMRHLRSLFLVLDAVGLVAFTLIGCQVSLEMGHSLLIAAISGVITGVFGGILRDILCNDVPLIFRRELYASVSFASAWCYLICVELELPSEQAMLITLFSGFPVPPAGHPLPLGNAQVRLPGRFRPLKQAPAPGRRVPPTPRLPRCHGPRRGYPPHAHACRRPLPASVLQAQVAGVRSRSRWLGACLAHVATDRGDAEAAQVELGASASALASCRSAPTGARPKSGASTSANAAM